MESRGRTVSLAVYVETVFMLKMFIAGWQIFKYEKFMNWKKHDCFIAVFSFHEIYPEWTEHRGWLLLCLSPWTSPGVPPCLGVTVMPRLVSFPFHTQGRVLQVGTVYSCPGLGYVMPSNTLVCLYTNWGGRGKCKTQPWSQVCF
jgi:hypothetical protein